MISTVSNFGATEIKKKVDIETLVELKLPPSPGGMMKLTALLRDYNTSARAITQAINFEPTLVARILRLANSPLFALERNLTSVQQAISVIGTKSVYDIVLMEFASNTFAKEIKNSIHARKIWEHSIVVALIAKELSQTLGLRGSEEAFTCGLLHDIGKIILLINDFENYPAILETPEEIDLLRAENSAYGFNHTEVGALIARRWCLPQEISMTILHHHNPSQSEQLLLIAHIIDVADIIANVAGYGMRKETRQKLTNAESGIKLRLTEEHFDAIFTDLDKKVSEVLKSYR